MEEIADMLEEEPAFIIPIYELIQDHPDWDDERIRGELMESEKKKNLSSIFENVPQNLQH